MSPYSFFLLLFGFNESLKIQSHMSMDGYGAVPDGPGPRRTWSGMIRAHFWSFPASPVGLRPPHAGANTVFLRTNTVATRTNTVATRTNTVATRNEHGYHTDD